VLRKATSETNQVSLPETAAVLIAARVVRLRRPPHGACAAASWSSPSRSRRESASNTSKTVLYVAVPTMRVGLFALPLLAHAVLEASSCFGSPHARRICLLAPGRACKDDDAEVGVRGDEPTALTMVVAPC